jgi:hypothetical protein
VNKRIKKLAEQAGLYVDLNGTPWPRAMSAEDCEAAYKKFAELIVKECAEQIIVKGTDWVDFAPSQTGVRPEYWNMAQQIKQHFEVEE